MRINNHITGDKAEVYRTEVLKKYPFPEFTGERFLSEAVVWNAISRDGLKLVFIDKGIYLCEYRSDGLTMAGRKLRLCNPMGTLEHAKAHFYKDIKFIIRAKYMLLYIATYPFAGMKARTACSQINSKILFALVYIPGKLLHLYWRLKYK
jgi:hypothetical protein